MESKSKKSDGINLKPYSSNEETKALPIVPRPTDSKKPIRNTPPVKQLRPIGKSQNSALNSSNPKNKPLPTKGKIPTSIKSTVQVKRPESNTSEITKLQENIAKNNRVNII